MLSIGHRTAGMRRVYSVPRQVQHDIHDTVYSVALEHTARVSFVIVGVCGNVVCVVRLARVVSCES